MGQTHSTTEDRKNLSVNKGDVRGPENAAILIKQKYYSVQPTNGEFSCNQKLEREIYKGVEAPTAPCVNRFNTETKNESDHLKGLQKSVVRTSEIPEHFESPPKISPPHISAQKNPIVTKNAVQNLDNESAKRPTAPVPVVSQSNSSCVKNYATVKEQSQTMPKSNENLKGSDNALTECADAGETKNSTPIHKRGRRNRNDFAEHRLFLGGLPEELTEAELKTALEEYGKVTDIMISIDKETSKSKRYGFVGFEDESSAKICLEKRFIIIKGKRVEVKQAWPQKSSTERKQDNKNDENDKSRILNKRIFHDDFPAALSTDGKSNTENASLNYQKLFDDYFKAKFAVQNLLGSENLSDERTNKEKLTEEQENENDFGSLLKHLCISIKDGSSLEDFCSDSEETDSETDEGASSANDSTTIKSEMDITNFQTMDRLICNVCKWRPLDNSVESFLTHCNTFDHKLKLKERFQETHEKTSTKDNNSCVNCNSSPKSITRLKKRRRNRMQSMERKKNENEKSKSGGKNTGTKWQYLKCDICNSRINFSKNPQILLQNLSQHVQSNRHLKSLKNKECLVQKSEDKKEMVADTKGKFGKKSQKCCENHQNKKNFEHSRTKPEMKSTESINESCKIINLDQLNILCETKVRFLCLPCNFFCSKPKTFLTHLYCDAHLTTLKEKWLPGLNVEGVSFESLCKTLTVCSKCNRYLFGSTSDIQKHFNHCKYAFKV